MKQRESGTFSCPSGDRDDNNLQGTRDHDRSKGGSWGPITCPVNSAYLSLVLF